MTCRLVAIMLINKLMIGDADVIDYWNYAAAIWCTMETISDVDVIKYYWISLHVICRWFDQEFSFEHDQPVIGRT